MKLIRSLSIFLLIPLFVGMAYEEVHMHLSETDLKIVQIATILVVSGLAYKWSSIYEIAQLREISEQSKNHRYYYLPNKEKGPYLGDPFAETTNDKNQPVQESEKIEQIVLPETVQKLAGEKSRL